MSIASMLAARKAAKRKQKREHPVIDEEKRDCLAGCVARIRGFHSTGTRMEDHEEEEFDDNEWHWNHDDDEE